MRRISPIFGLAAALLMPAIETHARLPATDEESKNISSIALNSQSSQRILYSIKPGQVFNPKVCLPYKQLKDNFANHSDVTHLRGRRIAHTNLSYDVYFYKTENERNPDAKNISSVLVNQPDKNVSCALTINGWQDSKDSNQFSFPVELGGMTVMDHLCSTYTAGFSYKMDEAV